MNILHLNHTDNKNSTYFLVLIAFLILNSKKNKLRFCHLCPCDLLNRIEFKLCILENIKNR